MQIDLCVNAESRRHAAYLAEWRYMVGACARFPWKGRAASPDYARRVEHFLIATGLHESYTLRYIRQVGYNYESDRGAWSHMQMEGIAIKDTRQRMQRDPSWKAELGRWVYGYPAIPVQDGLAWWWALGLPDACRAVAAIPKLAAGLARCYMLQFPAAIPPTAEAQSYVWSEDFNTRGEEDKRKRWLRVAREEVKPLIEALPWDAWTKPGLV